MNPTTLETMADEQHLLDERVLLDSGGAPLSQHTVQWYRDHVGDLWEGYGLTETCSLTHFEDEGTKATRGTVGCERPGVNTWIVEQDEKPVVHIEAPNIGVELDANG